MDDDQVTDQPIKVFVAMPGSEFGDNAEYDTAELVKNNVLVLIKEKLQARMNRLVDLKVETDKDSAGDIYKSMYSEAANADVYIADLTGANPNVYLELGVRWAFRKSVTIPIAQSDNDIRFNISKSRVFFYTPKTINDSCDRIADAIALGLRHNRCDSPILDATEIIWMKREEEQALKLEIASLREDIDRLRSGKAETVLRTARMKKDNHEKVRILEDALKQIPNSVEILLELGGAHFKLANYAHAEDFFRRAVDLDLDNAVAHRELGVTLSKSGKLSESISCLEESARLNGDDAETWSNLGGAFRRLATDGKDPDAWEENFLKRAQDCYVRAQEINQFNLYAGLNVARTGVALARQDQQRFEAARQMFETQSYLALYVVSKQPENYWLRFDLADCFMFTGDFVRSKQQFNEALALIPDDERPNTVSTVLSPLEDFSKLELPDEDTRNYLRDLIEMLQAIVQQH